MHQLRISSRSSHKSSVMINGAPASWKQPQPAAATKSAAAAGSGTGKSTCTGAQKKGTTGISSVVAYAWLTYISPIGLYQSSVEVPSNALISFLHGTCSHTAVVLLTSLHSGACFLCTCEVCSSSEVINFYSLLSSINSICSYLVELTSCHRIVVCPLCLDATQI